MNKKELLDLMIKPKSEGGINQIQESGFKIKFPDIYDDIIRIEFPMDFSFKQKLYHYLHDDFELKLGLCKKCGNRTKFKNIRLGYFDYCCNSCAQSDTDNIEKRKQTCFEKYGVENYNNRIKSKKTCLNKYGVNNVQQVSDIYKKALDTKHKKYGEHCEKITEKTKKTKLEKYGDANYNNQEKNKQTCLEKYGVENVFSYEEIKEKIKHTNMEKYGVEYPLQNKEIHDKRIETNVSKYGVLYPFLKGNIKCVTKDSKPNQNFANLLDNEGIIYEREFPIEKFSYDFKVNDILIEINPTATHNSHFGIYGKEPIKNDYHLNKSVLAETNGFHCIHVWDWDDMSKIICMLKNKKRLYARKLKVKPVSQELTNCFLNKYHLQNTCNGQKIRIGLFDDDKLVQIMTFGKPRYNKNYELELLRLCTCDDCIVIGGSEKIFKYLLEHYNPKNIISYCDASKFNGSVYKKLGFSTKKTSPSKHWYNIKTKRHITDNFLRQRGYDQLFGANYGKGTSNEELMIEHGFLPVYDCGQMTWTFENEKYINNNINKLF